VLNICFHGLKLEEKGNMKQMILKLHFAFVFSCTIIFTFAQNHAFNHSEAAELCADKGNLVANHYFPRVNVSLADYGMPRDSVHYSQLKHVELEDGESAWVAGYAKYSDSIYNHWGCYPYDNQNTFAASDNQGHRGFYQCSEYCEKQANDTSYYDILYLLINTTSCVCLKDVFEGNKTDVLKLMGLDYLWSYIGGKKDIKQTDFTNVLQLNTTATRLTGKHHPNVWKTKELCHPL